MQPKIIRPASDEIMDKLDKIVCSQIGECPLEKTARGCAFCADISDSIIEEYLLLTTKGNHIMTTAQDNEMEAERPNSPISALFRVFDDGGQMPLDAWTKLHIRSEETKAKRKASNEEV